MFSLSHFPQLLSLHSTPPPPSPTQPSFRLYKPPQRLVRFLRTPDRPLDPVLCKVHVLASSTAFTSFVWDEELASIRIKVLLHKLRSEVKLDSEPEGTSNDSQNESNRINLSDERSIQDSDGELRLSYQESELTVVHDITNAKSYDQHHDFSSGSDGEKYSYEEGDETSQLSNSPVFEQNLCELPSSCKESIAGSISSKESGTDRSDSSSDFVLEAENSYRDFLTDTSDNESCFDEGDSVDDEDENESSLLSAWSSKHSIREIANPDNGCHDSAPLDPSAREPKHEEIKRDAAGSAVASTGNSHETDASPSSDASTPLPSTEIAPIANVTSDKSLRNTASLGLSAREPKNKENKEGAADSAVASTGNSHGTDALPSSNASTPLPSTPSAPIANVGSHEPDTEDVEMEYVGEVSVKLSDVCMKTVTAPQTTSDPRRRTTSKDEGPVASSSKPPVPSLQRYIAQDDESLSICSPISANKGKGKSPYEPCHTGSSYYSQSAYDSQAADKSKTVPPTPLKKVADVLQTSRSSGGSGGGVAPNVPLCGEYSDLEDYDGEFNSGPAASSSTLQRAPVVPHLATSSQPDINDVDMECLGADPVKLSDVCKKAITVPQTTDPRRRTTDKDEVPTASASKPPVPSPPPFPSPISANKGKGKSSYIPYSAGFESYGSDYDSKDEEKSYIVAPVPSKEVAEVSQTSSSSGGRGGGAAPNVPLYNYDLEDYDGIYSVSAASSYALQRTPVVPILPTLPQPNVNDESLGAHSVKRSDVCEKAITAPQTADPRRRTTSKDEAPVASSSKPLVPSLQRYIAGDDGSRSFSSTVSANKGKGKSPHVPYCGGSSNGNYSLYNSEDEEKSYIVPAPSIKVAEVSQTSASSRGDADLFTRSGGGAAPTVFLNRDDLEDYEDDLDDYEDAQSSLHGAPNPPAPTSKAKTARAIEKTADFASSNEEEGTVLPSSLAASPTSEIIVSVPEQQLLSDIFDSDSDDDSLEVAGILAVRADMHISNDETECTPVPTVASTAHYDPDDENDITRFLQCGVRRRRGEALEDERPMKKPRFYQYQFNF